MILDSSAAPILERYKAAKDAEGEAIKALHSALASGERDQNRLLNLTEQMENAHNVAMAIYEELEAVRLDKPAQR